MKKLSKILLMACLLTGTVFFSCQKSDKEENVQPSQNGISKEVLQKIQDKGFGIANVRKIKDRHQQGYLVENDILLTEKQLASSPTSPRLRIADVEQYRTYNLVTALPRTFTISVWYMDQNFVDATNIAIQRYNALGLRISFNLVVDQDGADMYVYGEDMGGGALGYSGFPENGDPYPYIAMNNSLYSADTYYLASIIAHEIGHCIGFRHTDWFNRAISCGSGGNEGDGGVGAIQIPGTPSGADYASWMLACTNGYDRPFNNNDRVALNYLYR